MTTDHRPGPDVQQDLTDRFPYSGQAISTLATEACDLPPSLGGLP